MKKYLKIIATLVVIHGITVMNTFADPPDMLNPPNPGSSPIGNGNPVGAPIDEGLGFLLVLSACYGARKIYSIKNSLIK